MSNNKSLNELSDELRNMEVSDPVCMEKVLMYLDEINRESDEYMQVLLEKLSQAVITWYQPWYQEILTLKGKKIENCEGLPQFREDRFTTDEVERVKKNWNKLVKKFKIPDKLECFARWKNKRISPTFAAEENIRRFVNSYLARGLERTIYQVHRHVVNTYARSHKAHYTKDEEKIMEICFYHDPKYAVRIAAVVLDRGPRGILLKFNDTFKGKPEFKKIRWNLSLASKLLKLLMEYTGERLKGLKNKHIEMGIWRDVANHFETDAYYLRHFWYTSLHCQLFVKYNVTLRRVRKKVLKTLRKFPYKYWSDIRWKDVVSQFPEGFTFQFLYYITVRLFRNNRLHTTLPLEDVIKIGLQNLKRSNWESKRLKTLILNAEDELEVHMYEDKL